MVALRSGQEQAAFPRRVPVDLLPEHWPYRDTGCELSPSCLRCPLPRCKYDAPHERDAIERGRRDREIALLYERYGAPVPLLASTYGISRRQVFRILKTADTKKWGNKTPARRSSAPTRRARPRPRAPYPAQLSLPEPDPNA